MTGGRPTLRILVGVCALVAGCTSTVEGRGTRDAQAGPGTSSGTTGPHIALKRIPLRRADLPNGWVGHKPKPDDPNGDAFDKRFATCVGAVGGSGAINSVDGPDFDNGPAEISSSATRYASQHDVDHDVAILTSPRAEACMNTVLRAVLKKSMPAGAEVGAVEISITSGSNGGPDNVVATASGVITISEAGQSIQLFIDLAFITGSRTEADVDFFDVGAPVDPGLQQHLIRVVAERAARA